MADPARRPVRLRSYAKVNLGLEVLGLRDDGYHELRTLFQTIDLHDDIVLRPRARGVTVRCDHPLVPTDGTNLAARAAEALRAYARVSERGRDRDPEADPGRRRARGREQQRRRRPPRPRPDVEDGARARPASIAWPAAWGPTCPTSCWGGPPSASPGGTRSTPCAASCGPTSSSWTPGVHVSTAAGLPRLDARLTPRVNSNSIFCFVSRELEGSGGFRVLVERPRGGGAGGGARPARAGAAHPGSS